MFFLPKKDDRSLLYKENFADEKFMVNKITQVFRKWNGFFLFL